MIMNVNGMGTSFPAVLRGDDIFISSYPRSGNTWMRTWISDVLLQLNGYQTTSVLPITVKEIVPDIHQDDINSFNKGIANKSCRFIKSHWQYDKYAKKTIYIFRKPGDALCSYYQMVKDNNDGRVEFSCDQFCIENAPVWLQHTQSYISAINTNANVLFVSYEAMNFVPLQVLRRVFDFVCLKPTDDMLKKTVANHCFELKQANEAANSSKNYKGTFYRKGKINSSLEEIGVEAYLRLNSVTYQTYSSLKVLEESKL
jgi:hypothetical protein